MWFYDETVKKTVKVIVTVLVFAVVLYLAYQLRQVIFWLAIGTFLAIIINPAVSWFSQKLPGNRRGLAVATVVLIGLLLLGAISSLFVPPLVKQTSNLINNWPEISDNITAKVSSSHQQPYKFVRERGLTNYLQDNKEEIQDNLSRFFGQSVRKAGGVFSSIAGFFTILAVMVYMSISGPSYVTSIKKQFLRGKQKHFDELGGRVYKAVTGYVNGNLLTSGIAGVTTGVVSAIVGIPYPALMGIIVALMDLLPLIGATLGAAIVIVIALFISLKATVIMLIFFVIYQQFENYVLQPRVMSRTVEMSAFAVLVSAICGAVLAGVVGALVAIPIGASIQILVRYALGKIPEASKS